MEKISKNKKSEYDKMFVSIYEKYYKKIFLFINKNIGYDDIIAEDLTSDVFIKVYNKMDTFNCDLSQFNTWLYSIAKNVCKDYYRKSSKTDVVSLSDLKKEQNDGVFLEYQINSNCLNPYDILCNKQHIKSIICMVGKLKNKEMAEVYMLRYIHEYTYNEICEKKQFSLIKVKVLLHRANNILRAKLQEA